jgi:serine/threonine protein kinase
VADDTQPLARRTGATSTTELGRGDVVGGRWRLEEFLNSGGMGRVWRASDLRLAESVAIKLMDPALVETDNARARFMREARAAAQLRGPNVVSVLDFEVLASRSSTS